MRHTVVQIVAGLVVAVLGAVWLLQGVDLLDGGMRGDLIWAVIGAVVLVAGLVLAAGGLRTRRRL